ncbi:hypothetical protein UVI_02048090 [Ustilaginoidea virens]|nr:hypothetical protein UVI_02048090 [Ustilaginoidea virens]
MAQTAAKAVWGDGTEHCEPVSGVQGNVAKGEPYDAGNMEPDASSTTASQLQEPNRAGDTSAASRKLESESATRASRPVVAEHHDANHAIADATTTTEESSGDHVGSPVDTDNAPSVMGDGPRPLETVAKENGGDAGNLVVVPEAESTSSSQDLDGGASNPDTRNKTNKGTGEKYVKTSGLAADGGDFDATLPGAGREADRLLEEKGIQRGTGNNLKGSSSPGISHQDVDGKDKQSLKERLKDKLHIHKS